MEQIYNILWLDDDVEIIDILGDPLEKLDHRITRVGRCEEAVNFLQSTKYDAVIMEIILGKDSWTQQFNRRDYEYGIDVLRYMRAQTPNAKTPVIVYSVMPEEKIEGLTSGLEVKAVLRKPQFPRELTKECLRP